MNELDLVREFRADVGAATQEQLARGRDRLLEGIFGATAARRLPGRRARPLLARRVLVAVSVAAVAVVLALDVRGTHPPAPPAGSSKVHVRLAAQVLRTAAATVASQPTRRPAAHQWIYSAFTSKTIGQPAQRAESWIRFDGRQTAYLQNDQLLVHTGPRAASGAGSPMSAYDALYALPSSPRAILRAAGAAVAANPGSVAAPASSPSDQHQTRQQLAFQFLTQLLWQAAQAAPARAQAAAFRALATLPGVSAQPVTDAVGRPAIGLSDTGDEQQLLLDPQTYKIIGLRTLSNGSWPVSVMAKGPGPTYPKGTVIESDAWVTIAFVNGPGAR